MSVWIFQGKPSRYDIEEKFEEGKTETWLVSRYREEMQSGDIVFFWRSGTAEKRGVYGWGVIAGKPQYHKGWGWGVPVLYMQRFPRHLPAAELQNNPQIADNLIFRMPVGTNFRLEPDEAKALNEEVRNRFLATVDGT